MINLNEKSQLMEPVHIAAQVREVKCDAWKNASIWLLSGRHQARDETYQEWREKEKLIFTTG